MRTLPAESTRSTSIDYGCTESRTESGSGTKRFASFDYTYNVSQNQAVGCSGDSGGPAVVGNLGDNGDIWGVYSASSSVDFFSHVPWFYDTILNAMMAMTFANITDPAPTMAGIGLDGLALRSFTGAALDCQNACITDGYACEGWSRTGSTCKL